MKISITANRELGTKGKEIIDSTMKQLVTDPEVEVIHFGGALGGDTEALRAALKYRTGTKPELIVVVPDTLAQQPEETIAITKQADKIVELKNIIEPPFLAYHIRNQYLVDALSDEKDKLVAFYDYSGKGGTYSTIKIGRKQLKIEPQLIPINNE